MPRLVSCPNCKKAAPYDETNPSRPFCSERCRQIDLGQWASDGYAIPGQSVEVDDSNLSTTDDDDETTPSLH